MAEAILAIGLVVFLAHFFVALFRKTRIPDVLLLTVLGLILGPATHLVTPEQFGKVGPVISNIALIFILFESGITLEPSIIPRIWKPVLRITLITFGVTVTLSAACALYLLKLTPLVAAMLGVSLGGTSAAVVIALVKSMRMRDPAGTILIMESALGDVLCIIILIGLVEAAKVGQVNPGKLLGAILASLVMAGIVGMLGGVLWLAIWDVVRRSPNSAFTTVAFLFVLYGIADLLGFSGAITALSFGATLSNHEALQFKQLAPFRNLQLGAITQFDRMFYYELLFLLKVFFFIYLGVSMRSGEMDMILIALALVAAIYFCRIWIVRFGLLRKDVAWQEAALMSLLAPKGLVSAVLASIPVSAKIPGAEQLRDFTYLVVILSVLATAILIPLAERRPLNWFYRWLYSVSEPAEAQASSCC